MSGTFEDYEQEYNAILARVRNFLAGTRNITSLQECERLLESAKEAATAMQAMAEVDGNAMRVKEATMLIERDIGPLAREVNRALNEMSTNNNNYNNNNNTSPGMVDDNMNRQELFYQAPNSSNSYYSPSYNDMDSLIQSSEDLLRESQTVLAETEYIGNQTLHQMGRQREQLQNASNSLLRVQAVTQRAKTILVSMSRRACRSKLALYIMIGALTAANIFVLICIYNKHHNKQTDDSDEFTET